MANRPIGEFIFGQLLIKKSIVKPNILQAKPVQYVVSCVQLGAAWVIYKQKY